MKCELVDVFSTKKLNGNGLTIFSQCEDLSSEEMLSWAQEMRQFESIFLQIRNGRFHARMFTVEEELDFAGHPLLGLTYHLHHSFGSESSHEWVVHTNAKPVSLTSSRSAGSFVATMDQGKPDFLYSLTDQESQSLYRALNLTPPSNREFGAEVVSTGLPYVILPIVSQLEDINFTVKDLTPLIAPFGAKFLYVLDVNRFEGRSWDNSGALEDVATGSAAGPAAAFLFKHGLLTKNDFVLHQGRFLRRPSEIKVNLEVVNSEIENIRISANVVKVADIALVD